MPALQTPAHRESFAGPDSIHARFAAFRDRQIQVLEQLAAGATVARTLEAVIKMIQEQSPGTLASVLLLAEDGLHLRHGAAPDLPAEYCAVVDGLAIGPCVGSCGTAAFHARRVIVVDIATDPLWAEFKEIALGRCYLQSDTPESGPRGPELLVDWESSYPMTINPKGR